MGVRYYGPLRKHKILHIVTGNSFIDTIKIYIYMNISQLPSNRLEAFSTIPNIGNLASGLINYSQIYYRENPALNPSILEILCRDKIYTIDL